MENEIGNRDLEGRFVKGYTPITSFKKGNVPWNKGIDNRKRFICEYCNKVFYRYQKTQRYCTKECANKGFIHPKKGISKFTKEDRLRSSRKYNQSIKGKINSKIGKCKRRERMKNIHHNFTKIEWFLKLYKTHGFCPKCDKWIGIKKLTLDHTPPISKAPIGFEYTINDIQPLCFSCNNIKKAKMEV